MSRADGYIEVPAPIDVVEAGETVEVKLFCRCHDLDTSRTSVPPFGAVPSRRARECALDATHVPGEQGRVLLVFHRGTW